MAGRYANMIVGSLLVLAPIVGGCAAQKSAGTGTTGDGMNGASAMPAAARADMRPAPAEYRSIPQVVDIHFAFDRYDIGPEAATVLEKSAAWLKANPGHLLLIEGHADERGTNEYNTVLGDRRARASMNYLTSLGIGSSRITTISYGEERGLCSEHNEKCWARNRRAHFGVKPQ